ncbi:MAG: hypothetical protein J5915_07700, partial [Acidaminococcaceae bacterium]|nr:hypothetical protein [Acidaminococcaceae bacterium]
MEIGFGELLLTGILAMVLLKPEDLPMAAKKAAKVYLGIQGFMKKKLAGAGRRRGRKKGGIKNGTYRNFGITGYF